VLDRLVAHSVTLLAADAAGILLTDPRGQLRVVASSNEESDWTELLQVQTDEGPCVDCVRTGEPRTTRSGTWSGPSASTPPRSGPTSIPRGPGKGGCTTEWIEGLAVDGEHLGRSRGGLTSKIHLGVDGRGLPMSILLTPGQAGDNPQLLPLLDQIAMGRDGPGRPRKRPDRVVADKAYSHPSTRAALRQRGVGFTSPERRDQIAYRQAKGSCGGRPPAFDAEVYAGHNVVEGCFNRLK
jgi:transposase